MRISGVLALLVSVVTVALQSPLTEAQRRSTPDLAREALRATVLVVASDENGNEIRQGSGFVVADDGRVITNFHVIEHAHSAIIKFPNGAFYVIEGFIGIDTEKDIAVLKASGRDFPTLKLGDSDTVQVGEGVIAIGSPLALEATVSNGIISSVREVGDSPTTRLRVLQTTAPISSGSSGGALLNANGEVIGITTLQAMRGQNLNFAVPINYAKSLIGGSSVRPFLALRESLPETISAEPSGSASERSLPLYWTDLRTGFVYKVRMESDYGYVDLIPGKEWGEYRPYVYHRCEFKKALDETWNGKCWSRQPVTCSSFWQGQKVNWCTLESTHVATKVTNTRLEGYGDYPDFEKDFDCGKCKAKRTKRESWVFVPADRKPQ